jgi:predicted N-acetyltransferase YhbS
MMQILPEDPPRHADAIEHLFDRTFGPGHFAKTAERLREFSRSLPEISRVALEDDQVIGVCRVWPLTVGPAQARALFYGPVAVAPEHRGHRLGLRITAAALEAGRDAGWPAALLIGAPELFGEVGFTAAPKGRLVLPGPQDPGRILIRDLAGDAGALEGCVTAPRAARPAAGGG